MEIIRPDEKEKQKLLADALKRFAISVKEFESFHEKWIRFYKLYRNIIDVAEDNDEPTTGVPYGTGLVENLTSDIVEPILEQNPPCRIREKLPEHKKKAENFINVVSAYFQSPKFGTGFTGFIKECLITGNSWMLDTWADDWVEAEVNQIVEKVDMLGSIKSLAGAMINLRKPEAVRYPVTQKVKVKVPVCVGYQAVFPSVFDVFPEPGVKYVDKMHWLFHRERNVAVSDLKKVMWWNPENPNEDKYEPLYDFSEMDKDTGEHEDGTITPLPPKGDINYSSQYKQEVLGVTESNDNKAEGDTDRVDLLVMHAPEGRLVIGNGKWVFAYIKKPFSFPRIPTRLLTFCEDKEYLYSQGVLEMVENSLLELNDTHTLSFRNWIRIINRMVAVHMNALVDPTGGDLRSGMVRINTQTRVQDAIMPIEFSDVTASMANMESIDKGVIEFATGTADLSPGMGKQYHKTFGGLMEVTKNVAKRTKTLRRHVVYVLMDQVMSIERMFSQFQIVKLPFDTYGPDGKTAVSKMNWEDIDTGGIGFNYVYDTDPAFGDEAVQRNQLMVQMDVGIKYEQFRLTAGQRDLKRWKLDETAEQLIKAFGNSDTGSVLVSDSALLSPDEEFKLMLAGQPLQPQQGEDYITHVKDHMLKLHDPRLALGIQQGKINPVVADILTEHITKTILIAQTLLSDPKQLMYDNKMEDDNAGTEPGGGVKGPQVGGGLGGTAAPDSTGPESAKFS